MKMEAHYVIYEMKQEHFQREFHRDASHSQGRRKISNKKPKLTSIKNRKDEFFQKHKAIRKEIINVRGGINKINTKKLIEKINETKNWLFDGIE